MPLRLGSPRLALLLFALAPLLVAAAEPAARPPSAAGLAELAQGHEQVFQTVAPGPVSIVLQKGDKQFTIYGVVSVRAVGHVLEITVKNGEKYSVSPQDVFFITNNAFKI